MRIMGTALFTFLTFYWVWPVHSNENSVNQYNMGIIGLEPYAISKQDGSYTGYMVEIAREIRKATNFIGNDDVLPLKRLHAELSSGNVDCAFFARVAMTENAYELVSPLGKEIQSVIIPNLGITISTYDDLEDLIIAVPNGVTLDMKFDNDDTLNKTKTHSYMQSTMMLQKGRVDAMIGIWDSYLHNMLKIGMSRGEIGQPLILNEVSFWLMCRRDFNNVEVKSRLIDEVNRLRDQGVFNDIIEKYLGRI